MIPFRYIDRFLIFFGFVFLTGALQAMLTTFDSTTGGVNSSGNRNIQIVSIIIYVPTIFLIVHRIEAFFNLVSKNIVLFIFLSLPVFSVFWSLAPDVTARRVSALIGTMLFISYAAVALSPQQALRTMAVAFGAVALGCLVFAVALPGIGTHEAGPYAGVWRGLYHHKNKFGGMMTLAATTIVICPKYSKAEILSGRICASIAVFLVFMSQSKTALVMLVCILLAVPAVHWVSGRGRRTLERIFVVAFLGSVLIAIAVQNTSNILQMLGKDETLTGRTETWNMAWDRVLDRPILGYGYRVFWTDKSPARLGAVEGWRDDISHAHNSYLDLALDLGFVGVGGFIVIVFIFTKRLTGVILKRKDPISLWMFTFMLYMFVVGITGRSILEQSEIVWAIFILSYMYLSMNKTDTSDKENASEMPNFFQQRARDSTIVTTLSG